MAITLKDIREKTFSSQVRNGYDPNEVDDFLDEIAEQMERLIRDNRDLKQKLADKAPAAEASAPVAPAQDDSSYFRNLETTLRDTLVSAQRVAEQTVTEAQEKADKTVADANEQANSILASAQAQVVDMEAKLEQLKGATESYRNSFIALLKGQAEVLNMNEELF